VLGLAVVAGSWLLAAVGWGKIFIAVAAGGWLLEIFSTYPIFFLKM
jgi:hypothetical protein